MAALSQHWCKTIEASWFGYEAAPLRLSIPTKYSEFPTEITLYLYNDALTAALVKAINETVAAHPHPETAEAAE